MPLCCMQAPGRQPVWHDAYTLEGVPLDALPLLSATVFDVGPERSEPIGSHRHSVHAAMDAC
jgi:hypothetical protein